MSTAYQLGHEEALSLDGVAGKIEGAWLEPKVKQGEYIAILGHPHSLHGGTMNNKVITTLARIFDELGIPSLRFNFRGVGSSEGSYDAGIGESDDMVVIGQQLRQQYPKAQFILAGFSFGSFVTYRACYSLDASLLISIAPSVDNYDYACLDTVPSPWIVVVPLADEVVSSENTLNFTKTITPTPLVKTFPDTSHFFHRKLVDLKHYLLPTIREILSL